MAKPVGEAPALRSSPLPLLIAVLLIPAALGSSTTIFNDGDVSWHIATGQWILAHQAIPRTDPFSFTWAGKPWVPIEWLAEVALGAAYRVARYSGVAALVTAALIALHAIVYTNAARRVRPWIAVGIIVAMDVVLIPMMFARPHLLAWPLIAGWTWLMLRARERDRAPPLVAALCMLIWANLHGSFVMGLVIAAAFGLEALIFSADRRRAFKQWALFGGACLAAVFVNANGLAGVVHPLRIANLQMLPLIDEWKPSSPSVTPWFFGLLAIALALVAWKRPRLEWTRWLLLGGLLALALLQARHQAVLAIVAAMVLPRGFVHTPARPPIARGPVLAAVSGAVLLLIARLVMPLAPPENGTNPRKLIAAVPPQLRSAPVLNGYSMGGPLILAGIRPYIDGRGDMYGDELVIGYSRIMKGDREALGQAVAQWNIRWAIFPHDAKKVLALLDGTPGWTRVARDPAGVIYIRTNG
jgi:hypothetical protein